MVWILPAVVKLFHVTWGRGRGLGASAGGLCAFSTGAPMLIRGAWTLGGGGAGGLGGGGGTPAPPKFNHWSHGRPVFY